MANGLEMKKDPSLSSTITFVKKFDKAFDCLNVKSYNQGVKRRNKNLMQYSRPEDDRLEVSCVIQYCYVLPLPLHLLTVSHHCVLLLFLMMEWFGFG